MPEGLPGQSESLTLMAMTGILSPAEIAYIEKLPARVTQLKRLFLLVSLVLLGFVAASLHSALQLGNEHGLTGLREILRVFLQFDPKPDHSYTGWEICLVNKMGGAFVGLLLQLLNWSGFQGWWRCREGLIKLYKDLAEAAQSFKWVVESTAMYKFKRSPYLFIIADILLSLSCYMEYRLVMKIAVLIGIKDWKELLTFYLRLHYRPDEIYHGWVIVLHQKATMALMLFGLAIFIIPFLYLTYKIDSYPYTLISKILSALKQNFSDTGS